MINDVNCCWGDPDSVMYTVEGENEIHELDLRSHGYVFGIWDGVFVMGDDDDDTAGLMHDEFLLYYIYYNGWPKRDIVPLKDINEDAWDYYIAKNIPVEYDNYSYYDDDENVLPEYQMTYGDLLEKLGSPKARGRVLVDHDNGWIEFVAFWGEPTLEEKKLVYKNIGNPYVVVFNNINEAREFYLYEGNKVFTFKEWIQSGKYIPRVKKDEEAFALHNMKAKDKWNNTVTFRDVRDAKNAKKLGDMTMAQYNSLKYQENRKMVKNVINEAEVKRRFKNLISTTQLLKRISQYGYEGDYTEQALYILLDKYGVKPKTKRGGKSYFNKKNACDCIGRHIFELREIAEELRHEDEQSAYDDYNSQDNVGYGRDDMSVASREALANDGVFGADENELYANESIFNFKNIVNEVLSFIDEGYQRPINKFDVLYKLPRPSDLSNVETTAHWTERDGRKKEFANLCSNAGRPVYSFVVDTGHPNGPEIHTLTENGFIFIQNRRTKRVVTFILPSVNRFCKYWDVLGIQYPNDGTFNKILGRVNRNNKEIKNIRR